jgi:tRNA pseudouridine55 synthase
MDGLLIVDKPSGPTSHDVVARLRRVLRERASAIPARSIPWPPRPAARRRASDAAGAFSERERQGVRRGDAAAASPRTQATAGDPIARAASGEAPAIERDAIERALDEFRGTFLQQPPVYSAKKIGGRRATRWRGRGMSRGSAPRRAVPLRLNRDGPTAQLIAVRATCDVGLDCSRLLRPVARARPRRAAGTARHLAELRRTRSGDYTVDEAMPLDAAERDPRRAAERVIPLSQMLRRFRSWN